MLYTLVFPLPLLYLLFNLLNLFNRLNFYILEPLNIININNFKFIEEKVIYININDKFNNKQ